MEGIGDTQGQRVTAGVADLVIPPEEPIFSVSDLLGSRLAPLVSGGKDPVGGILICEGGSTGGFGVHTQFSLDACTKAPAVASEGSESDLVAFLRSMRERPGDAVPPYGLGEFSTFLPLPEFPYEIPYTAFSEQRMYPIRQTPVLASLSFPGLADDEAIYLLSSFGSLALSL